jgi:trans-L-3-hydroxyproline dehydratase
VDSGRVTGVSFLNVPSFVLQLDARVDVPGIGHLRCDLAFGGAFYAYVVASDIGLQLDQHSARAIIDAGRAIKRAVSEQHTIGHPMHEQLAFLYGTIFVGPPVTSDAHSRNVCVFADGEVDRSPTGTGVSGRLAIHHARGELAIGEPIIIESIIGSRFTGSVEAETRCGPYPAIVPRVEGRAFITGRHEFVIDPQDPLARGFLVR